MTMTYEFGDGCEVCTTICGMGCETVTPWNESLKFLAGVKKSIAVFSGEEALERYLANEKIVGDQVFMVLVL